MSGPSIATQQHPLTAATLGTIVLIDNRRIERPAKPAGAPKVETASIDLHIQFADRLEAGQPVCVVHADTPGELHYAPGNTAVSRDIVGISPE